MAYLGKTLSSSRASQRAAGPSARIFEEIRRLSDPLYLLPWLVAVPNHQLAWRRYHGLTGPPPIGLHEMATLWPVSANESQLYENKHNTLSHFLAATGGASSCLTTADTHT
eukprot:scaffold3852_cov402-Prasinococcus_capsulatus_cf.AAC.16